MSGRTFRVDPEIAGAQHGPPGTESSAELAASPGTLLTTTVPKELVHRANGAEVMLTGWERTDDSHFTVRAQLPRRHSFFDVVEGRHDPLLLTEAVRQAGILLAHAEFGVPLGHQFLMHDLAVEAVPENLLARDTPTSLDIVVACSDVRRRGDSLAGLRIDATIRRGQDVAATSVGSFACASPAVYQRLRRITEPVPLALTSPTAPQDVGRVSPMDVVLSPTPHPRCWRLRVDTRHPVLFDHPVDHVPGMLLLEAARQAAAALLGQPFLPVGFAGEFFTYTELDVPCLIRACPLPVDADGRDRVFVTGHQGDRLVFSTGVTSVRAHT